MKPDQIRFIQALGLFLVTIAAWTLFLLQT